MHAVAGKKAEHAVRSLANETFPYVRISETSSKGYYTQIAVNGFFYATTAPDYAAATY